MLMRSLAFHLYLGFPLFFFFVISVVSFQLIFSIFISLKHAEDDNYFRYNQPGKPSGLASVDVFVSTADPLKESPIVISNTILSILSVDYPAEKVSCYVSDEGAARLTLETLSLTCDFARKWVPFCKKFQIEPPSPESYFSQKVDHLKYNPYPTFSKERRLMKVRFFFLVI